MHTLSQFPRSPDLESASEDYASRFYGATGDWFIERQLQGTLRLLKENIQHDNPCTILDVGGGHGQNLSILDELDCELTILGSPQSPTGQIKRAIESGICDYITSPLHELPFEDNHFDVVICFRILAHIEDWEVFCQELIRVSRDLIIVDFASSRSVNRIGDLLFSLKKGIESNTRHYRVHQPAEIKHVFKTYAANYAGHYAQYLFPMAIHRAMKKPSISKALEWIPEKLGLSKFFGSPVLYCCKKVGS